MRVPSGYTIVEVMIVLAVSGVIFAGSITIFEGRRQSTEFSQAMLDLQSQFQSYSTQVSTANLPSGSTLYACNVSATLNNGKVHPYLTSSTQTNESTSNQNCLFLGRAVQVIPNTSTIYEYPVLGLRTVYNGSNDTGALPSTTSQANPEPALDVSGNFLLTAPYTLLNGTKVTAAHFNGSATEQDFLAVYTSLQNGNTSGNQTNAFARNYTFLSSDAPPQVSNLRNCVEETRCGSSTSLTSNTSWNLCVANNAGTKTASLNLKGTTTGLAVTVNMDSCP